MSIEIKPGFYYENDVPVVNNDTTQTLNYKRDEHVPIIFTADQNLRKAIANLMLDAFMDGSFPEQDTSPDAKGYNPDDVIDLKSGCKPRPSHQQNYLKLRKGY